ncbi:MAG: hypothetical protein HY905_20075 [Deltaproteobacteria bacterium]|nr:hypothetical protein [Deltaproteobacteria bacterium]
MRGRIAIGCLLASLVAGCSLSPYFENAPQCAEGETRDRALACGPCLMGTATDICDERRQWVEIQCDDPTDADHDMFPNYECVLGGPVDCNDTDPAVFPGATGLEECIYQATEACTTACGTPGTRTCDAACIWGPCTAQEACNNHVDDDCDGETDELDPDQCAPGTTVPCTTNCESTGTGTCTAECRAAGADACDPPSEVCNSADDDCDTETDEDFRCLPGSTVECTTTCDSLGHGTCTDGCAVPPRADCSPGIEQCNGQDDNCDGVTDEGWPCAAGAIDRTCTPVGGGSGYRVCSLTCTWGACMVNTETCNGLDDDGNGQTDETFDCIQGGSTPCETTCDVAAHRSATGTGTCSTSCTLPAPAACTPPAEVCDGADNDCISGADNGFTCVRGSTVACTTTCATTGTGTCTDACAIPAVASCTPPSETCNGVDDDCVSGPDNGFPCVRRSTVACTTTCGTTGTGACTDACTIPAAASCTPPSETCNGVDDDCRGGPDDIFQCVRGSSESCAHILCGGTRTCPSCGWTACSGYDTPSVTLYDGTNYTGSTHGSPYPWGSGCVYIGDDWASSMKVQLNAGQWINLRDESCGSSPGTVCSFVGTGCEGDIPDLSAFGCTAGSGTVGGIGYICRASPCDGGESTMNNTVNSIKWSTGSYDWAAP